MTQANNSTPTLFSIIIPCYNYGGLILQALESITSQGKDLLTNINYEIIVINDCSTDNTKQILADYNTPAKKTNNFSLQIINNDKNKGAAASRNIGIDKSSGQYIIFLDADDKLTPRSLNTIYNFITNNNYPKVIISNHSNIHSNNNSNNNTNYLSTKPFTKHAEPGSNNNLLSNKNKVISSSSKRRLKDYLFNKKLSITAGSIVFDKSIFSKIKFAEKLKLNEDIPVFTYAIVNYKPLHLNYTTVTILKHGTSLRNQVELLDTDLNTNYLADMIFSSNNMPPELLYLKKYYLSLRYLSLFRSFYLAKDYKKSNYFYHKAIFNNIFNLFKIKYLSKYIKSKIP